MAEAMARARRRRRRRDRRRRDRASGVSSAAFHEVFPDREACLLAAFDLGVWRARKADARRIRRGAALARRDQGGACRVSAFLEDEPALGRVLVVHSMSGGEQVLRRRVEVLDALAAAVDRGRFEGPAGRQQPPAVVAEGVVGAVLTVLQNRLLADERRR